MSNSLYLHMHVSSKGITSLQSQLQNPFPKSLRTSGFSCSVESRLLVQFKSGTVKMESLDTIWPDWSLFQVCVFWVWLEAVLLTHCCSAQCGPPWSPNSCSNWMLFCSSWTLFCSSYSYGFLGDFPCFLFSPAFHSCILFVMQHQASGTIVQEAETWINVLWSCRKPFPLIKLKSIDFISNFFFSLCNHIQGLSTALKLAGLLL